MGIFRRGRPSRQAPPNKPGLYRFRNRKDWRDRLYRRDREFGA